MKRIVIKVGTSTLTGGSGSPDRVYINSLAAQIADQRAFGRQVVLVSSGAIRAGMLRLGLAEKPRTIPAKQATASVGQGVLMGIYADIFANYGIAVGQVLLTRDDLSHRARYVNARNTFEALLAVGALPIVNENDTVAIDEIKVGDNDTLAALVTSLVDADLLILLSDVNGLYDKNPTVHADAQLVETVTRVTPEIRAMAGGAGTPGGTGGMITKLNAAAIAVSSGAGMWIAHGRRPRIVAECLAGMRGAGTYFHPAAKRPSARKRWLAWASGHPRGVVTVNACARRALEEEGRSLLPVGVIGVAGEFGAGDPVDIADGNGETFARGLTDYAAAELRAVAGLPTAALPDIRRPEVVHRDRLALLS
ncbi:MAG: glutamate 5-kinase [Capsulimonadales bacterium]|nr:glutamate 5-kinase [Capsulimonadales bacterium]